MIKNPLISVVMPVYGVEEYLRDAIESIINQTIGFENNIELIIVNDGSPDNSEAICLEYKNKYPNNIVYIKQKNQGLSATRYNGFLKARGKYFHSMDSDDTITTNFYEKSVDFLANNSNRIDFVASKLLFFEARTGGHYLNYRFKSTRVIDITKEEDAFQYHIASVLIKTSALKKEWFDKNISIAEDARIIAILLKEKMAYGVVSDIAYNYRIREAGDSLINTQHLKKDFYTETPKRFWQFILDYWQDADGTLPKYIQKYVLNDIQWRINEQKTQTILSKSEEKVYKKTVYDTVARLDDDVILECKRLELYKRIFLLRKKYKNAGLNLTLNKKGYSLGDSLVINPKRDFFGVVIDFIKPLGKGKFLIEGYPLNDTLHPEDRVLFRTSKGDFPLTYVERSQRKIDSFLGDAFKKQEAFQVTIEVDDRDKIEAVLHSFTSQEFYIPIITKRNTRIGRVNSSYRIIGDLVIRKENEKLGVYTKSTARLLWFESVLWLKILKNVRLVDAYKLFKEHIILNRYGSFSKKLKALIYSTARSGYFVIRNFVLNFRSLFLRLLYRLGAYNSNKPIWIVSDRGIGAGDNGEAFFKYLMSRKSLPADVYFVIDKKAQDYKRMKSIGPTLKLHSLKYKMLFIRSSKIISSQADEYVINPFGMRESHLVDLFRFDFVFLQHGVTKNDISDWLNRFFKDIKLFITVSDKEYKSILEYPFYYTEKEVALTGFPRYDFLDNNPQNKIIIAPTWRKYLTSGKVSSGGKWDYQEEFKDSDYFNFYNRLINDPRMISAMKKRGIKGEFYLHPSHSEQIKDFEGNSVFSVMSYPYNYKKAFSEGNLLITDYSSVYFDFSYLRKPVIYSQFDKDYYYEHHGVYERGYFDEARDGFGPAVDNYEDLISHVVSSVESNFLMENKYINRINKFFKYNDKNNSKRVYNAILGIKNKDKRH